MNSLYSSLLTVLSEGSMHRVCVLGNSSYYTLVGGAPEAYGSRFVRVYVYMCVCICMSVTRVSLRPLQVGTAECNAGTTRQYMYLKLNSLGFLI